MYFALLFPGQGAQYSGMCENYLHEFPYIKQFFLEANEILGFDILELCRHDPDNKLNLTINAQPAILILGYCAFQILQRETGIKPFLMAGHSLGEISALCCSGAINFHDAVKIVRRRGELMQNAVKDNTGAMLAINGLSLNEIESLCSLDSTGDKVVISNINSRNQIVVSGEKESVENLGDKAKKAGAITIPLKVSAPFHSPMMKPVAKDFEIELSNYVFRDLKYPVISSVTCKPYLNQNEIIPLLSEQVTTKINWLKIMEYIGKTRVDATIELPPKKTLTGFFKKQKNITNNFTFEQLEYIKQVSGVLAG